MTRISRHSPYEYHGPASTTVLPTMEVFVQLVMQRVEALAPVGKRAQFEALTKQALQEAQVLLDDAYSPAVGTLPVSKLKASEVIAQGLVKISQATLYRAVEAGRFYCITPKGRSTGKEFPAWQFIEPVPELIDSIAPLLSHYPNSEIHAFWVTATDELNELSPAEVLAGKPFDTRTGLHGSQQAMLAQPPRMRVANVKSVADKLGRMADTIG